MNDQMAMSEQLRKALTHAVTAYGIEPSTENYTRVMQAHDDCVGAIARGPLSVLNLQRRYRLDYSHARQLRGDLLTLVGYHEDQPLSEASAPTQSEAPSSETSLTALRSQPEGAGEQCICAAIRTKDSRIIRGHRHGDCFQTALHIPGVDIKGAEQGFITSTNRFVDRYEGMRLQNEAGIESVEGYRGDILFSEDLY